MLSYDNFILRGLAKGTLRDQALEGLERRRERRLAKNKEVTDSLLRLWHLVGDFDGKLHERVNVKETDPRPVVYIIAYCGEPFGPLAGSDPTEAIRAVILQQKNRSAPACPKEDP